MSKTERIESEQIARIAHKVESLSIADLKHRVQNIVRGKEHKPRLIPDGNGWYSVQR